MAFTIRTIWFCSTDVGYAAGDYGIIAKTLDGGISWQYLNTNTNTDFQSIIFPSDSQNGWAAGERGRVYRTQNGGISWYSQSLPEEFVINKIYICAGLDIGWVVGENGKIYKTENSGRDWFPQVSGTTKNLRDISFPSGIDTGYIVGDGGLILKTSSGGTTWSGLTSGTDYDLLSIDFPVGINTGFVTGNGNINLITVNAGNEWKGGVSAPPRKMNAVQFVSEVQGYKVGTGGILLKTVQRDSDGLPVWDELTSGTINNLYAISFPGDQNTGYVCGDDGVVLKTSDAGMTWSDVSVDTTVPSGYFTFTKEQGSDVDVAMTNTQDIFVRTITTNADQVIISDSDDFTSNIKTFSITNQQMYFPYKISSGDGYKTIYVQIINSVTNQQIVKFSTIYLDTIAPQPTQDSSKDIYAIEGPESTLDSDIQLKVNATEENPLNSTIYVMFSNNAAFNEGGEEWFVVENKFYNWTLSGNSNEYKTVYAKFKDVAGNESEPVYTTIAYGSVVPPPEVTGIEVTVVKDMIHLDWLSL